MSVLAGNPSALTDRAVDLQDTSRTIQDVIDSLRGIVDDDESRAVEALHGLAGEVQGQLERIHDRYDGTARAITDYAVALTDAHAEAEAAQEDLDAARVDAASAAGEVETWERVIEGAPDDADTMRQEDRLVSAQQALATANAAVAEAEERIEQARRHMEEAAEDAITRIQHAIAETNEGFWDQVGEFFDDLGDFFEDLADWVSEFFAQVVDFLEELGATITAILEALALLALIVAIGAAFGPLGLATAFLVAAGLAAFIAWSIASDVGATTPEVRHFDPTEGPRNGHVLLKDPTLATVLNGTTEVDKLGRQDESVVKVTRVLGPDGWYYTVTLPSTQEWLSRFGDEGAVNDLDSNLALMLTPALDTQYERAVVEAMGQAGITADDHVMMVGFSQGGIMAGHVAAYNSELGIDAVVVSGAPIDHMPIPDSVDVVSVQHDFDPVPRLDSLVGDGAPGHGGNWTTVRTESGGASSPLDTLDIHNSKEYSLTLQDNIDQINAHHPGLVTYFAHGDLPSSSTYYNWQE